MDWSEVRQKSAAELLRLLNEKRELLRDRRFKVAQGQHKDVREIRELKHDIARLQTKLHETSPKVISPSTPQTS